MLTTFRTLAYIRRFSNTLLEKGRFAIATTRNIKNTTLNHQIKICQTQDQLQQIFNLNCKVFNKTNLISLIKKASLTKIQSNINQKKDSFIKSIFLQIQIHWNQLISYQEHQEHNNFLILLRFLVENKIQDLNHKIMEFDLLQFFNNANQNQKGIMLSLLITHNLQTQFDQKYAGLKGQILGNAEYIRSSHIKANDLIGQNIINILIYSTPMHLRHLIILWRKIIKKNLDTKFFNNYIVSRVIQSAQIKNKEDQLTLKHYIYLLKAIQSVKHDIQNKDIEKIIKNYPKNAQDISTAQIYIFYKLIKYLPQLKQFIQYQLKLLGKEKLQIGKQIQQNQVILLKLVQNSAIKKIRNANLTNLNNVVYCLSNLNQFYSHPSQLIRQIQQNFIKIISKQETKCNHQQLSSFLVNLVNLYKPLKFSQIENFYRKIVQFMIQQNLDQLTTKNFTLFLQLLSVFRIIQQTKERRLVKGEIFGYKNQLLQKISSTLKNPKRVIDLIDIFVIIKSLKRINIANQDLCKFIKKQIQTIQETLQDQEKLEKIKDIKTRQITNSCCLAIKNCICKYKPQPEKKAMFNPIKKERGSQY